MAVLHGGVVRAEIRTTLEGEDCGDIDTLNELR
jgi:hypothetical protein